MTDDYELSVFFMSSVLPDPLSRLVYGIVSLLFSSIWFCRYS